MNTILILIKKKIVQRLSFALTGRPKCDFCMFFSFCFYDFVTYFVKYLMKKLPIFVTYMKIFNIFLLSCKDLRSGNIAEKSDSPLKFLWNFHGNVFLLFIFIKWKIYWNYFFTVTCEMRCWNSICIKGRLCKMVDFKLQAVKNSVSFLKVFRF